ncbi:copper chaperone PCu(A)C [Pusillimonas sp. TS35]|uniref:copper chaperone PCu(A)C n=1 Tax=Paracandidimonas lactea TaxID=2895524 RepID=UPI00136F7481|nr:copper chaperone PCu(A)C [Paracandidimonas lactea]MYN14874.1 copper chaperone PCu(A)C [Pusillimonas sp. TS35]
MRIRILAGMLFLGAVSLPLAAGAAQGGHSMQGQGAMQHGGMGMQGQGGHGMAGAMHGVTADFADRLANASVSTTLVVSDCWIRSLPAPAPSGGYFSLRNNGDKPVTLLAAASPAYGMVMLHRTTNEGGMSRMSETHEISVDVGGTLEFKPGGYHLMLGHAPSAPVVGSKVDLELLFDNGQKAVTQCEIRPANAKIH